MSYHPPGKAQQRSVPFQLPDRSTPSGQALARRLHGELFIWLTTVDEQGIPLMMDVTSLA